MNRQENFKEGSKVILATANNNQPNANIVMSLWLIDNKLLVANCQMTTTITNLQANKNICVIGWYYRLRWTVELFDSGEYFQIAQEKSKGFIVKHAILITINEIWDLDKLEIIW
jgi:hypothetical protein